MSPLAEHCYGYQNTDIQGYYVATAKLEIGCKSMEHLGEHENYFKLLRLTQLKSMTQTSENKFHVHEEPHDMIRPSPQSPHKMPVYDIEPILRASQSLFGTVSHHRFPLMAGAHVPCAVKEAYSLDPKTNKSTSGWLWSYLSLFIAENCHVDAYSIVEDAGLLTQMRLKEKSRKIRE